MPENNGNNTWSEEEYLECLHGERRRFSWVMQRYGGLSPTRAEAAAVERYPYEEASEEPHRGLIFHDEAWRWAMLKIHGERWWIDHPELSSPPDEYEALE
ncbi:hypothetical protein [Nocardia amamiensis]|uniref:hypothetical protein n=1 Tax=Nocardia amamiensis TaxID=404578 RepID=UPI0008354B5C|nr:hypothetical protein [Nocardia amamiensis]